MDNIILLLLAGMVWQSAAWSCWHNLLPLAIFIANCDFPLLLATCACCHVHMPLSIFHTCVMCGTHSCLLITTPPLPGLWYSLLPPNHPPLPGLWFPPGHDTSSTTLTSCVSQLHDHPEVVAELRKEQAAVVALHGDAISAAAIRDMPYADAVIRHVLQ